MIESQRVVSFFKDTDTYLKKNPIIKLRKEIINKLIGVRKNISILDVGCGEGSLTIDFITQNKITFLDITTEMLELVKSRIPLKYKSNAKFINLSIFEFSPNEKYDIIVCVGVFAHITDLDALTKKLTVLLKPEGIIIIQFSNSQNFIIKLSRLKNWMLSKNKYNYNLNTCSLKQIKKIIRNCQLEIIFRESYWPISPFFLLFNYNLKIRLLFFFHYNKVLSKLGSEKIFVLKFQ